MNRTGDNRRDRSFRTFLGVRCIDIEGPDELDVSRGYLGALPEDSTLRFGASDGVCMVEGYASWELLVSLLPERRQASLQMTMARDGLDSAWLALLQGVLTQPQGNYGRAIGLFSLVCDG